MLGIDPPCTLRGPPSSPKAPQGRFVITVLASGLRRIPEPQKYVK